MNDETKKQITWTICVTLIILAIIIFCIVWYILNKSVIIRFEMDNNTLEAVKSINWTALYNRQI